MRTTTERSVSTIGLAGDVWPFLDDRGTALVREYFDPCQGFSGAAFDTFAGGGDRDESRDAFDPTDLVAVSLLNVHVPGHAALAILGPCAAELHDLLRQVPCDVDLWDAPAALVEPTSAAGTLWARLEALPGVGWVIAAKLLARKRPRLLPVYDRVVKDALQPESRSFWLPLRQELEDVDLRGRIAEIGHEVGLDHRVPLLRVLDVAVWMRNRPGSDDPLPFTPRVSSA